MRMRSDAKLVELARKGSRDAAGELFSRHWRDAWRAAYAVTGRRAMADDVAQDAFERAFAALSRFDARRPFAPWLHRIVVNRALDLLRSERRLVPEPPDDLASTDAEDGDRALLGPAALAGSRWSSTGGCGSRRGGEPGSRGFPSAPRSCRRMRCTSQSGSVAR